MTNILILVIIWRVIIIVKSRKIRIIRGKWRGYKISIPYYLKIRPTTDRIREMIFSWLDPVIVGSICLDCFTGSGALGLESLSRGAKQVTFIDYNWLCIKKLLQTMEFFKIYGSEVIHSNCLLWLQKKQYHIAYDIVFLDPPFRSDFICKVIFLLENYHYLSNVAWIYIETSVDQDICNFHNKIIPNFWTLYRFKITRTIRCYLYKRIKNRF